MLLALHARFKEGYTWQFGNYVEQVWKDAYWASQIDWTNATNRVGYYPGVSAPNTFNEYYSIDNRGGYVVWYCSGTTMTSFTAWINDYYDPGTSNRRRAVTGHELGHGVSLGHSTVTPALMGGNPNPEIYYRPQPDDINGIYDRFRW